MNYSPQAKFELSHQHVDLWPVRITSADEVAHFAEILSPEEQARAARFRFPDLQRAFVLSHGALRVLLGRYLGVDARRIEYSYGARGKPRLALPQGLEFSASESGGLAVFAFTLDCELGVDLEQVRAIHGLDQIAARFFCREEAEDLLALPAGERTRAFFACWTRKEACIKATGQGLSAPLNSFRVTLRPGEPARFLHFAHDPGENRAWTLHDLDLGPELGSAYAGALAYRAAPRRTCMHSVMEPAGLIGLT